MLNLLLLLSLQDAPRALDERLEVQLVAEAPQIVTPVAIDVDAKGRIWVIESNTHFPPKNYKGHPSDRILVFSDLDESGKARKVQTFADGFRYGMSLALRPDGVYFATRWEILRLNDKDGDGVCDERTTLVKLETKGDYPHNGLCGFAFQGGRMYFGMGENLGAPYELVGSDGSKHPGGGEGGNVFEAKIDGSKVRRIATGVWNPFHMALDGKGNLFLVDNDPDSRPPCRLLHVVEGGDYGFKFRNGRKGLHPFTAWNGELPGTLPMVSGTGEAPSGMIFYHAGGLPEEFDGAFLVTSWGDHMLQRFRLQPRGASFVSVAENFVKGGENFRPVGIAAGPDGALYVSDWVDRSYTLHGKGRIWRVRSGHQARVVSPPRRAGPLERMKDILATPSKDALPALVPVLADPDPFLASAAITAIARLSDARFLHEHSRAKDPKIRIGILLAMRRTGEAHYRESIPEFLEDPDPGVRRAAMQWIGEDGLREFAKPLAAVAARPPVTRDVFEAYLAAMDFLESKGPNKVDATGSEAFIAKIFEDAEQPAALRALALGMLRPGHPAATVPKLAELAKGPDPALALEAARALSARPDAPAQEALRNLAADGPAALADVVLLGLGHSAATSADTRALLLKAADRPAAVQSLAAALSDPDAKAAVEKADPEKAAVAAGRDFAGRPSDEAGWKAALEGAGDAAAGERVFFHPTGPQCFKCHRAGGRGGTVGPDLTTVGGVLTRERLIESILAPSREVAPLFVGWKFRLKNGDVLDGRLMSEGDKGAMTIVNAKAETIVLKAEDVLDRKPSDVSLMPDKLQAAMTVKEFRDLLAYLQGLR